MLSTNSTFALLLFAWPNEAELLSLNATPSANALHQRIADKGIQ
jgi:hypothetical protein